jgi:hypothetical protein
VPSTVIVDMKGQDFGEDCPRKGGSQADGVISEEPEAILYHPKVIWRPRLADVQASDPLGRNPWSRGLRYILEQRGDRGGEFGVTVIADEMLWMAPVERVSSWVQLLVCTGMGLGIGMWGASQRPARVYRNWFSESIWAVSFRLRIKEDRERLQNELGVDCGPLLNLRPAVKGRRSGDYLVMQQGDDAWRGPFFGT